MTDYSQLKDSILEQAHEKGRKLVAEATAKVQAESQLQEARLVEEKLHQRAVQLQTIERRLQRESQQIENQKRQSTLVTKQRVLKELFADAYQKMATWSRQEELAFLHRVLPRYADRAMVLTLGAVTAEKLTDQDRQDLIEQKKRLPKRLVLSFPLAKWMPATSTVIWLMLCGRSRASIWQPAFLKKRRTRRGYE